MSILVNQTISRGTLRSQDLLSTYVDFLTNQGVDLESLLDNRALVSEALKDDLHEYWLSEDACWDLQAIEGAMEDLAPEGTWFGAHPGDGSDFGFWSFNLMEAF